MKTSTSKESVHECALRVIRMGQPHDRSNGFERGFMRYLAVCIETFEAYISPPQSEVERLFGLGYGTVVPGKIKFLKDQLVVIEEFDIWPDHCAVFASGQHPVIGVHTKNFRKAIEHDL